MALVEGPTLQKAIDDGNFDDDRAVRLLIEISRAVGYAHRAGILHRDLKPDNILMSEGERPLLTDFGLAKWCRGGTLLTRTGQVLGTPNYMSPQQASGSDDVDETSDVYSLGAILYALLTGTPPHGLGSAAEILRSVLQDDPMPPRGIRPAIAVSLENICLKAIARDPSERYASADEVADDLQRLIEGEPVAADQSGLLGQVARELRRDQHQRFFVDWSRTLVRIGIAILIAHIAISTLDAMGYPRWLSFWVPRLSMFLVIVGIIYRARDGRMTPRTVAERPVYSIWLGYLSSLFVANVLTLLGVVPQTSLFPITATLSGFGFLAMSGHVWGGTAILGLAFMLTALALPFCAVWAPLVFGAMWCVALTVLASHYRGISDTQTAKTKL